MPHVHDMSIFAVDRIEVAFDRVLNCYEIKLFADALDIPEDHNQHLAQRGRRRTPQAAP
jgi:hypothetical protein